MMDKSVDENLNIERDVHDVLSSWLASKKSVPDSWNGETNEIKPMPYAKANAVGTYGCSAIVTRARKTRHRIKTLSDIFAEVASAIQVEAEAARTNLEAVKNMYGLVALPDELLVRTFKFIVNDDPNISHTMRWRAALRLSHVCQHFREIALSCSRLWTSVGRNEAITALCLPRSRNVPLNVDLFIVCENKTDSLRCEEGFLQLLPLAHRWKHLHIGFQSKYKYDDYHGRKQRLSETDISEAFRNLDAPLLYSLDIDKSKTSMYLETPAFENWKTPNLRRLTSKNIFPSLLPGLSSITTLDITVLSHHSELSDLLEVLSKMRALENFALKLERDTDRASGFESDEESDIEEVEQFAQVSVPSVRRLKIEAVLNGTSISLLKRTFFSSLSFPGSVDMYIRLRGESYQKRSEYNDDWDDSVDFGKELDCILRDRGQLPRVKNFHLDVFGESWDNGDVLKSGLNLVNFPLRVLPNLKNFIVRSNRELGMRRRSSQGGYWTGAGANPPRKTSQPMQIASPAIQTITIDTPNPRRELPWVVLVVEELKNCGCCEAFRELITLEYDGDSANDPGTNEDSWKTVKYSRSPFTRMELRKYSIARLTQMLS